MRRIIIVALICLCAIVTSCQAGTIRRVKVLPSGASNGDGTTWANAYGSIQDAIDASSSGDEVWIMAYHDGTVYNQKIALKDGVSVKGGYLGDDGDDDLRDIGDDPIYITTISASGLDDCVVYANNIADSAQTIIEYCTIRDGVGRLVNVSSYFGGGIYCTNASPAIRHCVISNNNTVQYGVGGGIFADINSAPNIEYCTIDSNISTGSGGGIYIYKGNCSNNHITNNTSTPFSGGGVYIGDYAGDVVFVGNTVSSNRAVEYDGNGGGVYISHASSSILIYDNNIEDNIANRGGGIYVATPCNIDNCRIRNNDALHRNGGGIYISGSGASITNCIVSGNTAGGDLSSPGNGGGICASSSCTISNCEISGNSTTCGFGGGISAVGCTINNNKIIDNHAASTDPIIAGGGGGVYLSASGGTPYSLYCNVIEGNTSVGCAGGVYITSGSSPLTFNNNTVVGNTGGSCYRFSAMGTYISTSITISLYNNIFADNDGYGLFMPRAYNSYNNCFNGNDTNYNRAPTISQNDIFSAPGFASDGYHLATGSPCINTGNENAVGTGWTDIDEESRQAGVVDIGADEVYSVATPTFDPGSSTYCMDGACDYIWVKITCQTEGATILYTVDGSNPVPGSPTTRVYDPSGLVRVPVTGTVKAVATKFGVSSSVGSATYTLYCPPPDPDNPPPPYVEPTCDEINPAPAITCLSVDRIFLPGTMHISWQSTHDSYEIKRIDLSDNSEVPIGVTTDKYIDDLSFEWGKSYQYAVRGLGHACSSSYFVHFGQGDWSYISVTPVKLAAKENQAVDSRIDTRKATDVPINVQFGDKCYRGGLFVGATSEPDQSRVGRSFLKFQMPELPSDNWLWAASVNACYNKSATNAISNAVGCQMVENDYWVDHGVNCIQWSSSLDLFPNFNPANALDTVTVNTTSVPQGTWCNWNSMFNDIAYETRPDGDRIISFGLAQLDEPDPTHVINNQSITWAYFVKNEYNPALGPKIAYAYGDAKAKVIDFVLSAPSVQGGNTVTGTVKLNRPAPAGTTINVSCSGSNSCCPAKGLSKTVPVGAQTATITISTAIISAQTSVNVTASCINSDAITRQLTITQ